MSHVDEIKGLLEKAEEVCIEIERQNRLVELFKAKQANAAAEADRLRGDLDALVAKGAPLGISANKLRVLANNRARELIEAGLFDVLPAEDEKPAKTVAKRKSRSKPDGRGGDGGQAPPAAGALPADLQDSDSAGDLRPPATNANLPEPRLAESPTADSWKFNALQADKLAFYEDGPSFAVVFLKAFNDSGVEFEQRRMLSLNIESIRRLGQEAPQTYPLVRDALLKAGLAPPA